MWVKICGIRDVKTAKQIVSLKPDAVGLNFFAKSPRCVDRRSGSRSRETGCRPCSDDGLHARHVATQLVAHDLNRMIADRVVDLYQLAVVD